MPQAPSLLSANRNLERWPARLLNVGGRRPARRRDRLDLCEELYLSLLLWDIVARKLSFRLRSKATRLHWPKAAGLQRASISAIAAILNRPGIAGGPNS